MTKVGILGLSEGNGHPFSFSAIINGYSDVDFGACGWPVIHAYLRARNPSEFGFPDVQVTHAWTQDGALTETLCRATKIPTAVANPTAMIGCVDAVIIARDDWRSHFDLAKPFLEAGLSVFVDKPLSLEARELSWFWQYLIAGKLMSCSGLRFAGELDSVRDQCGGRAMCINGTVVMDWERYGVHILDAVFSITDARPVSIARMDSDHEAYAIGMSDGSLLSVNAIGVAQKTFRLDLFGAAGRVSVDMHDNFVAFRNTLGRFLGMCATQIPAIPPADTLMIMRTLMAGKLATRGGANVRISEIHIPGTV